MDAVLVGQYYSELRRALWLTALRAGLFFKHEAYDNEKEFRFLQIFNSLDPVPNVKQKCRRYQMVRYREFDWRTPCIGALKRIIVGPAADQTRAEEFAWACLAELGYTGVKVTSSGIPYRAVS